MLSRTFTSILKSGRAEFNHRFQEAKHTFPELSADAFARFLHTCVDPLVQAVANVDSGQAAQTASAAYDAALELVGQKLAGSSGSNGNYIEEGWRSILQPCASLVSGAPARAIAAVCNALHHLATAGSGARPAQWIREMAELAPACDRLSIFLTIGQIAAWRAGLAHYRESALAAAEKIPPDLARRAVGAPPNADWQQVRARLLKDPWYDPAKPEAESKLRIAARAGAFRGFGGLFTEPPRVAAAGNHFLIRSSAEAWLLTADVFGVTFHRADIAEFEIAAGDSLPPQVRIQGNAVSSNNRKLQLPHTVASAAANDCTLAVTSPLSHQVTLIALK